MLDILWDALLDTLKLLPFLFLTYTAMEYLEHRWQGGGLLQKAGRLGPLWGGLLGVVPQCGFSAAAAGLYAGRVVSLGTMMAVFLSTSDEMLPLLLSRGAPAAEVLQILGLKAAAGIVCGFLSTAVPRPIRLTRSAKRSTAAADTGASSPPLFFTRWKSPFFCWLSTSCWGCCSISPERTCCSGC